MPPDRAPRCFVPPADGPERDEPPSVGNRLDHRVAEALDRFLTHLAHWNGAPVSEPQLAQLFHGAVPPREAAARTRMSCSEAGMYSPSMSTSAARTMGPMSCHRFS